MAGYHYTRSSKSRCGREWLALSRYQRGRKAIWPGRCSLWPVLPDDKGFQKLMRSHGCGRKRTKPATSAQWGNLSCHRIRVFIIASKYKEIALSLHRPVLKFRTLPRNKTQCSAFYWTAGLQSICYSVGFVPTLKVGSALSIPSQPALQFGKCVRKATPEECLRFQGFDAHDFSDLRAKDVFRMTGNAVAQPVGQFVMDSICCTGQEIELHQADLFSYNAFCSVLTATAKYMMDWWVWKDLNLLLWLKRPLHHRKCFKPNAWWADRDLNSALRFKRPLHRHQCFQPTLSRSNIGTPYRIQTCHLRVHGALFK